MPYSLFINIIIWALLGTYCPLSLPVVDLLVIAAMFEAAVHISQCLCSYYIKIISI